MAKILSVLVLLMLSVTISNGQITPPGHVDGDSTVTDQQEIISENDDVKIEEIETYADQFVPRKASLYSAIFPGGGQIYNKKYWKLPIIYGGFVSLGITIDYWNGQYRKQRRELFKTLNDSGYSSIYGGEAQLRSNVDKARRERDFYMILTGALYLLQIADAHIDAHLKEFDLNPDLKVTIEPSLKSTTYYGYNAGISLKLKF